MFYQVGNDEFRNKFLAARHAVNTGKPMHFNLYESAFDAANWAQEPAMTWDQMLDIRAQQLAALNKPIVFFFSGGTDSYTIYKVFERNNIHIDVAFIMAFPEEQDVQRRPIELMTKNWYDPHTRIIVRDGLDLIKNNSYRSPDWIWETNVRYQFGVIGADDTGGDEIANMLDTNDFVAVVGVEKPRLNFSSRGVFSYQDDEVYPRMMKDPRWHCFYITPDFPELHIKQSYMLLRYIQSLSPSATTTEELAKYNNVHRPKEFHWHRYSSGCGRFGDLNSSHLVHVANANMALHLTDDKNANNYQMTGRKAFLYQNLKDERIAQNYRLGVQSAIHDGAGRYLMQDPNNFFSIRQFQSKYYPMTFTPLLQS
jgi:hypothetical protein